MAREDALGILSMLGQVLAGSRLRRRFTQEQLARLTGFGLITVQAVERPGRDISYRNIRRWLAVCGVNWKDFGAELQRHNPLPSRMKDNGVCEAVFVEELPPLAALGVAVRTYRRVTRHSQEAFSFDCGLDRAQVAVIERGQRSPRFMTLHRIVERLPVSWTDFFDFVHRLDPIKESNEVD